MKPFEVALFKHFIVGKGMVTVYINSYRKHHIDKNPTSIEEFLLKVDVNNVCINAFYFVINQRWGYEYWSLMQKEWLEFLANNGKNCFADDWWKMQGVAKILRNNWDSEKFWQLEPRYKAAQRMGVDLSAYGIFGDKEKKKEEKEVVSTDEEKGSIDVLGDFVDVDIELSKRGRRFLKDDEITINLRNSQGRVTFNQTISGKIVANGGYNYATLMQNKNGDVIIKLNNENGVPITMPTNTRKNIVIGSIYFAKKLSEFVGTAKDLETVKIKEVATTDDFLAYLVTKK